MPEFSPDELAAWSGGQWIGPPPGTVSGFAIDSRTLQPGDCFIALQTARQDGHAFVAAAAKAGAAAALVARPVVDCRLPQLVVADPLRALHACARAHRQQFKGLVIGVTGSAGKTSTKELLARMLGLELTLATTGNLNNHLGVPLTLLRLECGRHRFAVVEAGINACGEMAQLAELIRPDAAILTNVGPAHLEGLGSVAGVAAEKALLLAAVPEPGWKVFPESCLRHTPIAALGGQRAVVGEAAEGSSANVIFQAKRKDSAETENDAAVSQTAADRDVSGRVSLQVDLPGRPVAFLKLPPLSAGMRMNMILAASLALLLGTDRGVVQAAVDGWQPAHCRGEIKHVGEQVFYLDCYNANPLAMSDALSFFSERYADRPRLFVIGSMRELGAESEAAHRQVGRVLRLRPGDRALFIGEQGELLRQGALDAGNSPDALMVLPETAQAADPVAAFAGAIFLKGSRVWRLESLVPAEAVASC